MQKQDNLELEIITLQVTSAGQTVSSVNTRTKAEHKKITGFAILSKGGYSANDVQGTFTLKDKKRQIISNNE